MSKNLICGDKAMNKLNRKNKPPLKRNSTRQFNHYQIIMEALKSAYPYFPTRYELEVSCRIRSSVFIKKLRYLIDRDQIFRLGEGTKTNGPYRYCLYSQKPDVDLNVEKKKSGLNLVFAG